MPSQTATGFTQVRLVDGIEWPEAPGKELDAPLGNDESADLAGRMREIERWRAEHDGRINEKWRQRDEQDHMDTEWRCRQDHRMAVIESSVKVLTAKVAWVSMLGGTLAGIAFQLVLRFVS